MGSIYEYRIWEEDREDQNHVSDSPPCDCFVIKLHFRHVLQLEYPQRTLIPMAAFHQSFTVPCTAFFNLGPTILHDVLSDTGVSQDFLDALAPEMLSFASDTANNNATQNVGGAIGLLVFVTTAYDDRREIERAIRESTEITRMALTVPATKSSIEGLKKVKIDLSCTIKECSVCLEEFRIELEVMRMPCSHLFHKDCIVRWLETSHLCPLCRFPMPT